MVDGKAYGLPKASNIKSLVWYSPSAFTEGGYEVPATLDDLKALSDKLATDGKTAWCVGAESGVATGWVLTDWMEDFMLRVNGEDVYDQWVNHEIPFNDPKVVAVVDAVGEYVKNADYLGGEACGQGDRHHQVPGRRPADPHGRLLHAPSGELLLVPVAARA